MASHPYISGPNNVTQMIGNLRKNFPSIVNSETVKKFGLASNNESYVINALQFLGVIDAEGRRTDAGQSVFTLHDENKFQEAFADLIRKAYKDLFDLRGEDAWTIPREDLIGYFRTTDKTSDVIGGRQAAVFQIFRQLSGHEVAGNGDKPSRPAKRAAKLNTMLSTRKPKIPISQESVGDKAPEGKIIRDMALTVRIEINLPGGGSQETYDAIFRSIKANLIES